MKTKRPTVRDVAREAGVSYQTVSRVINNNINVSDLTRDRVNSAIEMLGFRPNRAAQIMQTERSYTLEVVMPFNGFTRMLYDMARVANQLGYHFVISAIVPDQFAEALESGTSRFTDGFLLVPFPHLDDHDTLIRLANGIPFVQIGSRLGAKLPSVSSDQPQGARLAIQHLIGLGHQDIAEISGPLFNYDAQDRHETWLATLKEHGLTPGSSIEGDFTLNGGYDAMNRLLDIGKKFTAVFVGNDTMAFGAHTALRKRGLRVPEDVSIVGFDNIPESAHFLPGLTTVHQDSELMGRLAVEYLVSLIEKPDTPIYQQVLIPRLVVRGTTRPIS